MKKPELKDFELTEEMLIRNKKENADLDREIERIANERKKRRKIILYVLIAVSIVVLFICLFSSFESIAGAFLILCVFCDIGWGIYVFNTQGETVSNFDMHEWYELKQKIVNCEIEERIKTYDAALEEYNAKKSCINEQSLVKVKVFLTDDIVISETWVVFSNVYLSNPQSYPNICVPDKYDEEFEKYYQNILQKQKKTMPKPKKRLGIEGKLAFYYPCSDLFMKLKDKRVGDKVTIGIGATYQILNVYNPGYEE